MKKLFTSFIAAVLSLVLLTGCITPNNPTGTVAVAGHTIDPIATGKTIRLAAKYGATYEIKQAPETRAYFQMSATAIGVFIANGNYNPTNLTAAINQEVKDTRVSAAIADAIGIYNDFFAQLVTNKLDLSGKSPYTIPVLTGLALGLQDAVDATAPVAPLAAPLPVPAAPAPTNAVVKP